MTAHEPLAFDASPLGDAFGLLDGPVHLPSLTAPERERAIGQLRDWVTALGRVWRAGGGTRFTGDHVRRVGVARVAG